MGALNNARDLLDEAQLLLDANRHARAFALAALSAEELAKAFLYKSVLSGLNTHSEIRSHLTRHDAKLCHTVHVAVGAYLMEMLGADFLKALEHDRLVDHSQHISIDVLVRGIRRVITEGTPEGKEMYRRVRLLDTAHGKKMQALYVEVDKQGTHEPASRITAKEAGDLIAVVGWVLTGVAVMLSWDPAAFRWSMQLVNPHITKSTVETRGGQNG